VKKRKIRAITPFKVIEVGINQKPVCDFLLVINTDILSRTVAELSQLIVQILDTLRFWAPFGSLRTTYDIHLWLIEKRVVDFLLVLIELFSLGVTAVALWAKRDRKSAFRKGVGHHAPNFHAQEDVPHQLFLHG